MSPSHARKGGIKYRYYISSSLLQGAGDRAGSVSRVPAAEIEATVVKSVREHLNLLPSMDDRSLVNTFMRRVEIQRERLVIQLTDGSGNDSREVGGSSALHVTWQKTPSTRRREVILPEGSTSQTVRPMRSETRATLIASIARGRRWLDELVTNAAANTESIAKREACGVRKVNMMISLAFLAPDLVKAAIDGRLPRGIGVARLVDLPIEWSRQCEMLGLTAY
jgi:hypothetical protein